MKKQLAMILTVLSLSAALFVHAQKEPFRLQGGWMIVRLDERSPAEETQQLLELADLKEFSADSLFRFGYVGKLSGEGWIAEKVNRYTWELRRPLSEMSGGVLPNDGPICVDITSPASDIPLPPLAADGVLPGFPRGLNYGVNRFKGPASVTSHSDGTTVFTLSGNTAAREVYIAGNFNNWSTLATPMAKTANGWEARLSLRPGEYYYKFIVDGKWMHDSANDLKESDGFRGFNSVYFVYNKHFELQGFPQARKVIVAGSFNEWNEKELVMAKAGDRWIFDCYLEQGTHAYKFIVDKEWVLDPAAVVRPDGRGNLNSFTSIGDTLYFTLDGFTEARHVFLAGDFNAWNGGELELTRTADGWSIPYVLAPGTWAYKFIVDGKWITDPSNPVTVGDGDFRNSVLVVDANHVFTLSGFPDARSVLVTGSFNGWAEPGYPMQRGEDGNWSLPLYLPAGKHSYKFVVDGKWITDPGNPLWEENEYGTGNSFLWIGAEQIYFTE